MGIQEIRKQFEEAQEELAGRQETEALRELISRYREDERAGVQALLKRAEKQLDALQNERERMWEMKRFEREYGGKGPVCGIDEAGRGPLAGPVVAGAVILPEKEILYLNDSKKLSAKKREELYEVIDEEIAGLAGLSRVTVTRVLSRLAAQGRIERGYGGLRLLREQSASKEPT